jgi:Uma2 family endonuclease
MSTLDPAQITTAEQLLLHSHAFDPCELIRGELVLMTPAGAFHGRIEALLLAKIQSHIEANGLGKVFSGDTGFVLETSPDTVRSPDVAFVCTERVPPEPVEGFFPVPPDLAIEIRSPDDRNAEVLAKISQYLATGVHVVWDVNPKAKTVTAYRQDSEEVLHGNDTLTEESLLPGLSVDVKSLFTW